MLGIRNLLKGSIILLISNIVIKGINFLLLPLYTKYLSPEDYGLVDLAITAASFFISLFSLALDTGFFTFYYDQEDEIYRKKIFNSTFIMTLLIGIIPLLGLFFQDKLSLILFKEKNMVLMTLTLFFIFFSCAYLIPVAQVKIENKMGIFGTINVIIGIVSIIFNIIMITFLQMGYISLIITNVLIALLQFILYVFIIRKNISYKYFDFNLIKQILVYTFPLIPATISNWILTLSDRYFINTFYSNYEVGLYSVANKIITIILIILSAFQTAYTSFVFSNAKDKDGKDNFAKIFDLFMITFLVIALLISIFSKEIIMIMTSKEYWSAYTMVPFLVFGQVAYGIAFLLGAGMSIAKKSKYSMIVSWISAISNIVLNAILIPRFGATMASITTLISFLLIAILNYYFSQKFYKCNYKFLKALILFFVTLGLCLIMLNYSVVIKLIIVILLVLILLYSYRNTIKSFMNKPIK